MEKFDLNGAPESLPANDFFMDALNEYKMSNVCANNREHYRVKPYHERHKKKFDLARLSSLFFSVCSIATASFCVFSFIVPMFSMLPSWLCVGISVVLALAFLLILETGKHLSIPDAFKNKYQFGKVYVGNVAIIVFLVAFSAFLSYNGASKAFEYMSAPPALISVDSIESSFDSRFEALNQQDSTASAMTWKGKIVSDGRQLMNTVAERRKLIEQQMAYEKKIAMKENTRRTEISVADVGLWAFYFALFAIICDWFLFGSFWYQEHYKFNSHAQFSNVAINRLAHDVAINTTQFSKNPEPPKVKQPEQLNPDESKQIETTVLAESKKGIQDITNPVKHSEIVDNSMIHDDSIVLDAVLIQGWNKGQPMTKKQVLRKLNWAKGRLKHIEMANKSGVKNNGGKTETVKNNIRKFETALTQFKS